MKKWVWLAAAVLFFGAANVNAIGREKTQEVDARTFVLSSIGNSVDYATVGRELNNIEEALKKGNFDNRVITKYVSYLGNSVSRLEEARKQYDNDLKSVNKRIDSLGAMPRDGEEEFPLIAEKRKEYNEELIYQKGKVAEVDLLINRIEEITNMISSARKQALIGSLLSYQDPIIFPNNFLRATGEFVSFGFMILKSPLTWYGDLNEEDRATVHANIVPVILMILAALALGIFLRIMIIRHFGYNRTVNGTPPYFTKVVTAFLVACAYGIIPAVLLGSFCFWTVHNTILNTGFFGAVLSSVLLYSLFVFLANSVTRVVLAPYNSKWRLIKMDGDEARRLTKALYFSFSMFGICAMLQHIATLANSSLELLYFISVISTAVKAICTFWVIKMFFWEDFMVDVPEDADDNTSEDADNRTRRALRVIFVAGLLVVTIIGISLFGYPRLSAFIINRFLFSVLIAVVMLVLRQLLFESLKRLMLLNFWIKRLRVRRELAEKIDFWLDMTINPVFIVLAGLIILTIWGVSTDILLQSLKKLFFGFKIGGVEISLVQIILGIAVFFGTITGFKMLRARFLENILEHLDIDDGIKHSLASGFGFVGFVLAVVLAITIMGGNLSSLALVAGALSVGIGFGLQNIVNNFISGLILLFERPIKVGDWVKIDGEEGKIKQINIRATEIETFNKASVIIPNATLLSSSVTNLTHGNNWMRFNVKVGVAYGSDVEKVKKILLECAASNRKVLKKPEPYVLFQDFGSSSLDFELRGFCSNIWDGWMIPSELRFEINRRFIEDGIEIPFNQVVVHQADDNQEETAQKEEDNSNANE